jgi:hypothetical protein
MSGGGKTQQTQQTTTIPPEVLARYNAVNARAEKVADIPYQEYSQDPNAFVAPLSQTQQAGISNTNAMAGAAQPYYGAAANLAGQSAYNVDPGSLNVAQYYNPYTQAVAAPTLQALQQQQGTERSNLMNPQSMNSFGGGRGDIARALLSKQQTLGTAQAMNPIYKEGYDKAMANAIQQQGVALGAGQANRTNMQTLAQLYGNLGTGAQTAGLSGAKAQMDAGSLEQQTEQAGKTALLNQFKEKRAYPIQMAQMVAGIAEGTGPISGQTTTGTSPAGWSDERLKENIQRIGETDDGQPIYRYNFKGEKRTQIGLLAQEVEKHHPEAVGLAGGYKTVDYKKATQDAIHKDDGGPVQGSLPIGGDKWDIAGPTAKRTPIPLNLQGLGAVHEFAGSKGLPIMAGANGADIAKMLAPQATGLTPGALESKMAERASLPGSGPGGNPDYRAWRMGELDKQIAAAGGSPYVAPVGQPNLAGTPYTESLSTGGVAGGERYGFAGEGGSYVHPALAYYQQMMAKGVAPYGITIQPRTAPASLPKMGELPKAGPSTAQQIGEISSAAKTSGELASGAKSMYDNRPGIFRSDAENQAIAQAAELKKFEEAQAFAERLKKAQEAGFGKAHGGLARAHYNGNDGSFVMPYVGDSEEDPIAKAAAIKHEPAKSLQPSSSPSSASGSSPTSKLLGAAGVAQGLGKAAGLGGSGAGAAGAAGADAAAEAAAAAAGATGDLALAGGAAEGAGLLGGLGAAGGAAGAGLMAAMPWAIPILGAAALFAAKGGRIEARHGYKTEGFVPQTADEIEEIIKGFIPKNTQAESGGRNVPNAAGTSSAFGPGQFTTGTWSDAIKRDPALKDLTAEDRFDPAAQARVMPSHARYLASKFQENQLPVNEGNLRLGWAMGHAGGPAFAKNAANNPDALAYTVSDPAAVRANPTWFFKNGQPLTVAEAQEHLVSQLSQKPGGVGGGKPPSQSSGLAGGSAAGAARSPYQALLSDAVPGSLSPSTKAALTSENLWVPALAGIGSMLASPKPRFSQALGEGLVGATGAYTGLQKQQSETDKRSWETEQIRANLVTGSLTTDIKGRQVIRYLKPDNTYDLMEVVDYWKLPKDQRPRLDPGSQRKLDEMQAELSGGAGEPSKPEKKPAGSTAPPPGGAGGNPPPGGSTTPPAPGGSTTPPVPGGTPPAPPAPDEDAVSAPTISLPDDLKKAALAKSEAMYRAGTDATAAYPDVVRPAIEGASSAQNQRAPLGSLANSLAGQPRGENPLTPGKVQEVAQPVMAVANNLATMFGIRTPVLEADLGKTEVIRKNLKLLAAEATKSGNQTAHAAFVDMENAIPTNLNSSAAQAKMLADIYAINQRIIDRGNHHRMLRDAAGGPDERYIAQAPHAVSALDPDAAFNKKYSQAFYNDEKKALIKMFDEGPKGMKNNAGRPMSWYEFIHEHGAGLSQKDKNKIAKSLGAPGIMRYFGLGE